MLETKKTWTCDLCEKEEVTDGVNPLGWYVAVKVECLSRYMAADFCQECHRRCFCDTNSTYDVPKKEFKKTWWQKFFKMNPAPQPTPREETE